MKTILNKTAILLIIVQLLFVQTAPVTVFAEETATQGASVQTTENTNTSTPTPENNSVQTSPTPAPTLTEEEQERAALLERRARSQAAKEQYLKEAEQGDESRTDSASSANSIGVNPVSNVTNEGTIGQDSTIKTGDATVNGTASNIGNNNLAENGSAGVSGDGSGAHIVNSGNGSDSTNTGAIALSNDSATIQENNANLNNVLTQSATTGSNENSKNTGANSSIETGEANVTGTIINAVNTNAAGVMVSEFNIVDNHTGDYVLDFAAGCVTGCGTGSTSVKNAGNGSGSDNDSSIVTNNNKTTTQLNDALIGNELNLSADTGNNIASKNTGGDSNITTGDANVAGNVLNFANTNVAGNVIYAVVNIFGDLIGDIILTEDAINNCCGGQNLAAANTGNGSDSTNTSQIDIENNDTILQSNDAILDNALNLDAQTGNNQTSNNTGGSSKIETGNVTVDANLINVVNTNLVGGNMWLVIVNEAGKWVGKLLGAPEGSNFAASEGSDYTMDENGYITVTNSGNGSDSTNTGTVSETNNNTTTQGNTANIGNKLNLSANTGGNTASDNTGGNSNITTGDATIIANLVNFVNTNIVGNGKLVVSVVNVFGNWFGDFVTPGQEQQAKPNNNETAQNSNNAVGGTSSNNASSNSSNNSQSNSNANNNSSGTVKQEGLGTVEYTYAKVPSLPVFQTSHQGATITETTTNGETKVAGVHAENLGLLTQGADGKSKINLAYAVLLIPLVLLGLLTKKVVINKLLIKKN